MVADVVAHSREPSNPAGGDGLSPTYGASVAQETEPCPESVAKGTEATAPPRYLNLYLTWDNSSGGERTRTADFYVANALGPRRPPGPNSIVPGHDRSSVTARDRSRPSFSTATRDFRAKKRLLRKSYVCSGQPVFRYSRTARRTISETGTPRFLHGRTRAPLRSLSSRNDSTIDSPTPKGRTAPLPRLAQFFDVVAGLRLVGEALHQLVVDFPAGPRASADNLWNCGRIDITRITSSSSRTGSGSMMNLRHCTNRKGPSKGWKGDTGWGTAFVRSTAGPIYQALFGGFAAALTLARWRRRASASAREGCRVGYPSDGV